MAEHIEYQGNFSGSQIDTLLAKIQSSQVFTTEEKTKLASLVNYDDTEVKEDISDIETSLNSHKSDKANPHEVTKAQVGLGNVDNTSDANKPISTAVQTALNNKVDKVDGKSLSANDYTDAEKTKLAGVEAQANKTTVDSALSGTSTNPVQNKAVKTALDSKQNTINIKRVYKVPISSVPVNNIYFGVQMFPYELSTTNGLAVEVKNIGQGGLTIDPSKFTTQINTWGFRIYTTDNAYAGTIPDVEIKPST